MFLNADPKFGQLNMLNRILRVVIFIPIAIVLILLSIANRQDVILALNPFEPQDQILSITAPFFVFIFVAIMVGIIIGSILTWFSQGRHRQKARQTEAESIKWHREADKQKAKAEDLAQRSISTV